VNSTVLAFDYGSCRIGVAAGQNVTGSAQGIATLTTGGVQGPWPAIEQLISEWAPAALVVGLPLAFNGRETPLSLAARAFGKELLERFGLPVTFIDETLTSVEAEALISSATAPGKRVVDRRKSLRDQIAAQLILQTYLNEGASRTNLP